MLYKKYKEMGESKKKLRMAKKKDNPKCKNFETCGNYTNAKHSKWCYPCSLIWQCKQMGYEVTAELNDGKIQGLVLTRKDLIKK